jgi:hypothetical protein
VVWGNVIHLLLKLKVTGCKGKRSRAYYKSKEQAKSRMKKDYKELEKSVDKLCLQQSSL